MHYHCFTFFGRKLTLRLHYEYLDVLSLGKQFCIIFFGVLGWELVLLWSLVFVPADIQITLLRLGDYLRFINLYKYLLSIVLLQICNAVKLSFH